MSELNSQQQFNDIIQKYLEQLQNVGGRQDGNPEFEIRFGTKGIKSNTSIRDVLLSGGDPLLLSDQKISYLLSELASIPHVEFVRIGSRLPVFLPQRITPSLLNSFKSHPNLWMSIHVNHPKECTKELKDATRKSSTAVFFSHVHYLFSSSSYTLYSRDTTLCSFPQ